MGTELLRAGVPLTRCFEELNVTEPQRIRAIHAEYVAAGARLIKTNTFGANAVRLERFGLSNSVKEFNRAAARLAKQAGQGRDVAIAGSVGPLGIDAGEAAVLGVDRADCFREQICALLDGGAEVIFLETFTDLEEMAMALRVSQEMGDCVTICSFACRAD